MIDLHIHTNYSDGTDSPLEIFEKAGQLSLKQIAITDHNTVEGALKGAEICKNYSFDYLIGTELSCGWKGKDVHLLGYFGNTTTDFEEVNSFIKLGKEERIRQHKQIISKFNKLGFRINYDELLEYHPADNRNRVHICELLIKKGYMKSVNEIFDNYLKRDKPCYVEHKCPPLIKGIEAVHKCGGIAVIAHFYEYKMNDFEDFFSGAINILDGIECYHSKHTPVQSAMLEEVARRNNLCITGGSDYHGGVTPYVRLGCANVPDEFFQKLF